MDARAAARRDPCEVLQKIARVKLSSADVPLYKIFQENGLTMGIDISFAKAGKMERYPYLKPRHLLEVLSERYFHKVLGVPVHLAEQSLEIFWRKYRTLRPEHEIFQQYFPLPQLIPYYLHGDGGRGYKKEAVEILSMLPALGAGTNQSPVKLDRKRKHSDADQQGINLSGSSGATRFLFTVLSSLVFKKDLGLFDDLLELWGQQLHALLSDGFWAQGSMWRIVILGFTGDSPFVKKVGKMNRSFNNVRKTHASKNPQKGCCWLCHAGYEWEDVSYPFEHLGLVTPLWIQTSGLNNPLPWSDDGGRLLRYMLLDPAESAAAFFRADFFHVYHAGVGKDFAASALIYAMKQCFGLGSIRKNLAALNDELRNFLRRNKLHLHCGYLTEDLLGYSGTRDFPEGHWSKNMDTAILMKFVVDLLQNPDFHTKVASDEILVEILQTGIAMGNAVRIFFKGDYFMPSEDCQAVIRNGHAFLCGYAALVSMCHAANLCLFKLRPKIHYLNHIFLRVLQEWETAGIAVNPCAEATFMSEDFVGKTARISRRVDCKAIALKTLQRYIMWMQTALDKDLLLHLLG